MEKIAGEWFPEKKSKYRATLIGITHTKPINRKKIENFLLKLAGGTVTIITYKNAKILPQDTKKI